MNFHFFYFAEMLETPYYIHYSPMRMTIHKLVTSKYFDLAISAVIGLNVITMAMEFYMMPDVSILAVLFLNKKAKKHELISFSGFLGDYFLRDYFLGDYFLGDYFLGTSSWGHLEGLLGT